MKNLKNFLPKLQASLLITILLLATPLTSQAAAFNPPPARHQSSSPQQRFDWNFDFRSGMDFQDDLGRPTIWHGQVQPDPFTANVRRDANVSNRPPSARGGSTITPTDPSSWAFRNNQNHLQQDGFWNPIQNHETNAQPRFDNLQHGINAPSQPMSANNQSQSMQSQPTQAIGDGGLGGSGFLPPTSIGG